MYNNRCGEAMPSYDTPAMPVNQNMNMNMGMGMGCCPESTVMCQPVYECPQVECCHQVINYEVPQE